MKRRALFYFLPGKFFKLLLPLLAAWPLATRAATLDWDPASSSGATLGGPGPWNDLTTFNWWDSALTTQVQWNNANNDTARFGGTPGTGLVTIAGGGITAGGGVGAAEPWPNCHVHEAEPCEPPGCINPTDPFTGELLDPLAVAFLPGASDADTSTTGNCHSYAGESILPGVSGLPEMICCWNPWIA